MSEKTRAEEEVIEAAMENYRKGGYSADLFNACEALRREREPKPRYYVDHMGSDRGISTAARRSECRKPKSRSTDRLRAPPRP